MRLSLDCSKKVHKHTGSLPPPPPPEWCGDSTGPGRQPGSQLGQATANAAVQNNCVLTVAHLSRLKGAIADPEQPEWNSPPVVIHQQ
jgi:hypothetical protein